MGSNILGSIYTTTISAEKYIIIDSQNIELSGNVIIKEHVTLSNGLLNTNSIVPNVTNSATLGSSSKRWSNAYINDVSINNNLQVTGNVYISGNLEASNIYIKSVVDSSFANVYTRGLIDTSFANVYTRGYIDQSFQNVYTKAFIDQLFQNVYTRGVIDTSFQNVYTRSTIDTSFDNVYTRERVDLSFSNVYTRGVIDLSFQNVYTIGQVDLSFANVYTREHVDLSFANVYTRGVIDTSFTNVYTRIQVDNSFVTKRVVELSLNALLASSGGGGSSSSIVLTSITNDLVPLTTNTYNLGSTTIYWNNSYIKNLRVSNRAYQEISGDISWNAVNGYYGLVKDAYPGLNPLSSGVTAVQTWTSRTIQLNTWNSVCWSPQLMLFIAVTDTQTTYVIRSSNGINWIFTPAQNGTWTSVCWSPELALFVAVSLTGTTLWSSNGINWTYGTPFVNNWNDVCWSPELGLFVAVASNGTSNRVITSTNGKVWIRGTNIPNGSWKAVAWSPELKIFVAVSQAIDANYAMISSNGKDWVIQNNNTLISQWSDICWSPQLGIFVIVSITGSTMTYNGVIWTRSSAAGVIRSVCWSPELKIFVYIEDHINKRIGYSFNGNDWTVITYTTSTQATCICWSSELGIFVGLKGSSVMTSSLKWRPPTSYNVFDSSFNRIDETGKWDFSNIAVTTLNVTGTFTNSSDDRLKHNEVAIVNGLAVIDRLNPKFYQKTQTLLDASYNGDLSTHAWTYEAGLIAQEVLQIPDLSFAVSGGDYYQECYNYYDTSTNYYDTSTNYYDTSTNYINRANYDISYNLITQPYSLNYNSIYVYVFAAIKELHAKVKAQETSILNRQAIINNCSARIETLEQRNQV